ncbi:hypothetical protein HAV22_21405 [Massilia sp. TW-1]|uniref:Uncharacterized protein n=1 Tax=Telluria antibiotica TaxID=2717319 RepID=A0ABX0PIA5_9BURK|nr:hypothetical protein [Telluria antibiotica]NIA56193.1 hypothetical protein [Telluria antibiotica]
MSETQGYKLVHRICAHIEAELRLELPDTGNQTVENFQEFIARTSGRDLIAKIGELIEQHIDTVLVVNKFGKHFADRDANSMKAGKDVVAFRGFHNFLKKTPSVAKHGPIPAPVAIDVANDRSGSALRVLGILAALQAAASKP